MHLLINCTCFSFSIKTINIKYIKLGCDVELHVGCVIRFFLKEKLMQLYETKGKEESFPMFLVRYSVMDGIRANTIRCMMIFTIQD